jgi:oligosaccharyltransferase complex subunit alpha (ribophorin I)
VGAEHVRPVLTRSLAQLTAASLPRAAAACTPQIETRFPMFGGWKTQWYQGYNVPAAKFISVAGDEYTLNIDLGVPFESVVTDKISVRALACCGTLSLFCVRPLVSYPCMVVCVQVRVILPEGASVVSVKSPVDITVLPEERRFTYLDTPLTGRTVVTLLAHNLVDKSNDKLTVCSHPKAGFHWVKPCPNRLVVHVSHRSR